MKKLTIHPLTGNHELAEWTENYYRGRWSMVRFEDGSEWDEREVHLPQTAIAPNNRKETEEPYVPGKAPVAKDTWGVF